MPATNCPCGTENTYKTCCEPYIKGQKKAPTAESVMRARYTAYVKNEIDYVAKTHDPKGAHDFDEEAAKNWSVNTEWMGLEIKATEAGKENDEVGTVEFIARFKAPKGPEAQDHSHHEVSEFRKDEDTWYYVDGKTVRAPAARSGPKIGRNDPCHCGSGKKFKKCCAA